MRETLARRYWSDFERLAFELTTDCFNIVPTRVLRTQASKDGGFDAVFTHELGQLNDLVIAHEVLMEAKLRTEKNSIGLRAFAATMIIAFNGQTQCLVVVSNRDFSPQALSAARDFQWKSRMKVVLVSQRTLSAWVRPRFEQLAKRFPKSLLQDILLPSEDDEEPERTDIPGGAYPDAAPSGRLESGRGSHGGVAACEIVLDDALPPTLESISIAGSARQSVAHNLFEALMLDHGCAMVAGEAGSGKSHLVRAVLARLAAHQQVLGLVDLSQISTSRQLFLAVVAQLLGLEIGAVAREFAREDCRTIFSTLSGIAVPTEVVSAVVEILASPSAEKYRPQEVDQIHLVQYIKLVSSRGGSAKRIVVFHNLDKTTEETLEFTHAAISALVLGGVTVLVEAASESTSPLIGRLRWKHYTALFEHAATLGRFTVPALGLQDAIDLLLEYLPGLGKQRAQFICERVGCQPLFLHHAALWLKKRRIVEERSPSKHLIENPEVFFEGLRPEASVSILDRHIDLWRHDTELPFADLISAAALLNGQVSVRAVRAIMPPHVSVETVLDAAVATGLFLPDRKFEGLRVSHSLLLERMIESDEGRVAGYGGRRFARRLLAEKLLGQLPGLMPDDAVRDLLQSRLLAACTRWAEAWQSAMSAGAALSRQLQLSTAAESFQLCVQVAESAIEEGDDRGTGWRVEGLLELLQVENQRYRLTSQGNRKQLGALVALSKMPLTRGSKADERYARIRYLEWRSAFTTEKFDEALPIARDLFEFACAHKEIDPELAGRATAAFGTTLKALEQPEESEKIFASGEKAFPGSVFCRMERLSNLGALSLRRQPQIAIAYFEQILHELGGRIPLLERLHTEVDVAMALFLANRWDEAAAQAIRGIGAAEANGIPAQGARSRNVLGCVFWCRNALDDACEAFEWAILDAERSYMERFLWRFRVNLASAAAEAGHIATALANARWAEQRLVEARKSQWPALANAQSHVTSRWYIALLSIGLTYLRCGSIGEAERLEQELNALPYFASHLEAIGKGDFSAEIFSGTTHLKAGRITLTG